MSERLELTTRSGGKPAEGLISNMKENDLSSSRVADNAIIRLFPTFFSIISTIGPPGLISGRGPMTEITATGR
jgi:hypothetical protein